MCKQLQKPQSYSFPLICIFKRDCVWKLCFVVLFASLLIRFSSLLQDQADKFPLWRVYAATPASMKQGSLITLTCKSITAWTYHWLLNQLLLVMDYIYCRVSLQGVGCFGALFFYLWHSRTTSAVCCPLDVRRSMKAPMTLRSTAANQLNGEDSLIPHSLN